MVFSLLIPMATPVTAESTPPTTISAPENFAASNYRGTSVYCTLSAPDDLRELINKTNAERGYGMKILAQVDFKTDSGNWHYASDWDDGATFTKYTLNYYNSLTGGDKGFYLGHQQLAFKNMFPTDTNVPVEAAFTSWDWYKSHSMTLRSRFAIDFGNNNIVFSDWSNEYVLSNGNKMDYMKILNQNAPKILSSKIETLGVNKVPWVILQLDQHPDAIQMFNAASGNSMWTEIWLRKKGDQEFKNIGTASFTQENIYLDVSAYFEKKLDNYDAQAYEVKVRYKIDERAYQQSGATEYKLLYSPFSNILSYGMPEWSGNSTWATPELEKASKLGLIPDILKGADMTKNITREEFAEVALLMYEKASGITTTTPISPNPFVDTTNPQILKAFQLGIVKGYNDTEFRPKEFINREQVASMLTRAIKLIAPNADYSIEGAPIFTDNKDISGWALNDCLYIAKTGIIKGSDGKFMPRAITDAQKAVGYANNSREQALAMSVRTVEELAGQK
jgi:hypothetical protein